MGLQAMVNRRCTVQPALMWVKNSNTVGGKPQYPINPTEIRLRWDDQVEEIIDRMGRTVISTAVLLSPTPMPEGAWIWLGTLAEWRAMSTYPSRPTTLQGGWEIKLSGHIPGFGGEDLLYKARI